MFDSKKWLILFFVLALVGSIGGSLVAYLILKKREPAQAPAAVAKVETRASVEPTPAPAPVVEAKVEPKPTPAPVIVEDIIPEFRIVSRKEWKAKDPVSAMKPHTLSVISIHHTATPTYPDKDVGHKLRGLQDFSQREGALSSGKMKPAWPDVPYHFYIDVNGNVGEGRDINFVGDSATDYDATGHILIALEGNFENTKPTQAQMDVLFKMVAWLSAKYKIPAENIKSHQDYVSTACPGKNLLSRMDEIRQYGFKK